MIYLEQYQQCNILFIRCANGPTACQILSLTLFVSHLHPPSGPLAPIPVRPGPAGSRLVLLERPFSLCDPFRSPK